MAMTMMRTKRRNIIRIRREPLTRRFVRAVVVSFKYLLIAVSLPVAALAARELYMELMTTPYLEIRSIHIIDNKKVPADEVLEFAGIFPGQNIFSFRASSVESRITSHPFVEHAVVTRRLPGTVEVALVERTPAAFVRLDELYVMDRRGVIFKKYSRSDGLDLPVVTGLRSPAGKGDPFMEKDVLELIDVLMDRKEPTFNMDMVSELHVDPVHGITVYTVNRGLRLELGTGPYEWKLLRLDKVISSRRGGLVGVESVDLNGVRGVVVKFKAGVV